MVQAAGLWFKGIEPMESHPAQDTAHGDRRNVDGLRNLDPSPAFDAHRDDAGDDGKRRRPGLSMRPRIAVAQTVGALGLIPRDPLTHGTRTDAHGGGDEAHG